MLQSALVSQLNKDRIDWISEFKIVRKYNVPAYGHVPESLELCFMDKEGGKIQASVSNFLISKYDGLINKGDLVQVSQLSVIDNLRTFPIADHPYRIMFQRKTYVQPIVRRSFPTTLFKFKPFSDILAGGRKDDNPLFDIIGEIVDIKDSKLKGKGSSSKSNFVELLLEDLDGKRLPRLLWEHYCNQFHGLAEFQVV